MSRTSALYLAAACLILGLTLEPFAALLGEQLRRRHLADLANITHGRLHP